jgi:hypothetical protein
MEDEQKELIKASVDASLRPFANLIEKLFGGAVEQFGGMWSDSLAVRRQIRRISLFRKLQTAIDEVGFDPQQIPDNIWVPAIQEASLQDDETIQQQWANLLANAADPRATSAVLPSFPAILRELTFNDAHFLSNFYEKGYWSASPDPRTANKAKALWYPPQHLMAYYWHEAIGTESFEVLEQYLQVTLDTLERSGLVTKRYSPPSRMETADDPHIPPVKFGYEITNLGLMFISACRPPQKS